MACALCACASSVPPRHSATVRVVDSPDAVDRLYRYIDWNGLHHSAGAFVAKARRAGIDAIVLDKPSEAGERCIAAVARELRADAYRRQAGGGTERLAVSGRPASAACDIGDGNVRVGDAYFRHRIARVGALVVLDDGPPMEPAHAVAELTKQRARSLVAGRGSAEDLQCFDAIAREADVTLYEAGDDGVLIHPAVSAGETLSIACRR